VDEYVAMLEGDGRAQWQHPRKLVDALQIDPGMRVADVGTGSGYFLPLLNRAVAPDGTVVAQDIDRELLRSVRKRIREEDLKHVEPRLGEPGDPRLEPGCFDRILMVDVYHHVADPLALLRHLRRALAPEGRLFVVDFPPGGAVPLKVAGREHRVAPDRVLQQVRKTGFRLAREHDLLPHQFMLELVRGPQHSAPACPM
jgi:ubiquinone/menaquinone biosynthesis C-methylase UbiE